MQSLVSFNDVLLASSHNRNGVFKSVDGGDRWTPIHDGLPTTDVGALAVSDGALYIGVNEENFTATEDPTTGGIYRFAEDRNSWIPVQTEMRTAYIENDRRKGYHQMFSVEVFAISGDTFYVIAEMGSGYRLYRWRSGERYWTDISPHPEDWNVGDNELTGLAVEKDTIYIVADMDLFRSHNRGDTWSKLEFRASSSPRSIPQVTGAVVLGKTVFISTRESGVFRSTDRGKKWESVNEGLPQGYTSELHVIGDALYATNSGEGMYRLKDGRDTWEFVIPSFSDMLSGMSGVLAIVDGTLYAGIGESGVYRIALDD